MINPIKNKTTTLRNYLLERETLDRSQFEDIVENGISDDLKKDPVKRRVRRKSVKK